MSFRYEAECEIWASPGPGGWCFVTLPRELTEPLRAVRGQRTRAWGSMRVKARIGATCWSTSLFPDSRSGAFLLPVKAAVRKAEGVRVGDRVRVAIEADL